MNLKSLFLVVGILGSSAAHAGMTLTCGAMQPGTGDNIRFHALVVGSAELQCRDENGHANYFIDSDSFGAGLFAGISQNVVIKCSGDWSEFMNYPGPAIAELQGVSASCSAIIGAECSLMFHSRGRACAAYGLSTGLGAEISYQRVFIERVTETGGETLGF